MTKCMTLAILLLCAGGVSAGSLENNATFTMKTLQISKVNAEQYGENLITEEPVKAGESLAVPTCGVYDVKITGSEGQECVVPSVDICGWKIDPEDVSGCEPNYY